ncbi:hypothetical protein OZN62_07185 [Aurantiacibacter sp. MUD11]|uniref:hypothetical protein n=1 Tax=Aurantiacibacter sp. MUD11 TaxID=3003265 RepID=UPI0022AA28AB|nr:hypothetical protein [Aurantiacibacter sp. MUD11]WAT16731.1 hypothetical protein OZN62_07185 [Aurantiacibacter sp. MUD11]
MTTGQGKQPLPVQGDDVATAWRELRADGDIQFSQIDLPEQEPPPDWFLQFMDWLAMVFAPVGRLLVAIWPVLMWVLIGAAVLGVAYLLYEAYGPGFRRGKKAEASPEWTPREHEALALLEEADRLAAAGNFGEATHLLLKRSVGQIAEARPDLVEPSSTARELASEPRLPEAARKAFALIAAPVERSLFALGQLDEADWQGARAAYADFALAQKAVSA